MPLFAVFGQKTQLLRSTVAMVFAMFSIAALAQSTAQNSEKTFDKALPLVPSFDEVRMQHQASHARLLSREGQVLHRIRVDMRQRRGQWVALEDMSAAMRQAIVLSEDKRFYEHSGVDWQAVPGAAWANLWSRKTRGDSTITMQLAGLLHEDLRRPGSGRSVWQKLSQAALAQALEQSWSKAQVLEAYLNVVPFRGELVGLDALSRSMMGKAAHALDSREAAIAAALVRAPQAPPAAVAARACGVLRAARQAQEACIGLEEQATAYVARGGSAVGGQKFPAHQGHAPHVAQRWRAGLKNNTSAPAEARTTLSAPLQRMAHELLQRHLAELSGRNVEDSAVLVLDNATGQALAWVGSSGGLSSATEVDGVLALRQPGSTLKPFVYALALEQRKLTAASLLNDASAHMPTPHGLYIPQNYDRSFKDWVSVRTALGASLNVPAVRALNMMDLDAMHAQMSNLGMALPHSGGHYGLGLALGSPEVSLLQLTNAYRTLANAGRYSAVPPVVHTGAPGSREQRQAIEPAVAFIVSDMLADTNARARTFGTGSVLATRAWTAVKTGTSKDMRDNWAVGYSSRYTVGVWVGNASGAPMHNVSGTHGAAPVWAEIMNFLHASSPSRPPQVPPGLVKRQVRFDAHLGEASRAEWFLEGTEMAHIQASDFAINSGAALALSTAQNGKMTSQKNANSGRVIQPAAHTILALDPDIPPANQQLVLRSDAHGVSWWVGGKRVGQGAHATWAPMPGRHRIELRDAAGAAVLDVRPIEVRGAGMRLAAK